MEQGSTAFAAALTDAAKAINSPQSLQETLGGLNLYSTRTEGVHPDALQIAELFAAHAAIALGRSRYEHQLNEAVTSRQMIGQAIGILMQQYRINEDRAFQFLVRASRTSNIKLRTLAQEIVDNANRSFTGDGTEDGG